MPHRALLVLGFIVSLIACSGCGGGDAQRMLDLKETGLAYHAHHDAHQQGPANWDELIATAESTGIGGEGIRRVRAANYEMTWGVKFKDVTAGLSHTVLGKPPAAGGPELLMDGSVRR